MDGMEGGVGIPEVPGLQHIAHVGIFLELACQDSKGVLVSTGYCCCQ